MVNAGVKLLIFVKSEMLDFIWHFGLFWLFLWWYMHLLESYMHAYSMLNAALYLISTVNTCIYTHSHTHTHTHTQELACAPVSSVWSLCTLPLHMASIWNGRHKWYLTVINCQFSIKLLIFFLFLRCL